MSERTEKKPDYVLFPIEYSITSYLAQRTKKQVFTKVHVETTFLPRKSGQNLTNVFSIDWSRRKQAFVVIFFKSAFFHSKKYL